MGLFYWNFRFSLHSSLLPHHPLTYFQPAYCSVRFCFIKPWVSVLRDFNLLLEGAACWCFLWNEIKDWVYYPLLLINQKYINLESEPEDWPLVTSQDGLEPETGHPMSNSSKYPVIWSQEGRGASLSPLPSDTPTAHNLLLSPHLQAIKCGPEKAHLPTLTYSSLDSHFALAFIL